MLSPERHKGPFLPAFAASLVLAGALSALAAVDADARSRSAYSGPYGPGYVVAESRWGHGTISAPVRRGRTGWEVRLPRGTWIDCGRSCSQTLRQQTVDFWESNGTQAKDGGPGYLHLEFRF